ncbi:MULTISPECIES: TadE/TadG family type IV pilus assembly protein [unclassified Janthinobacterium]|uniref:TadE/TadG family type IV pilus assembly protein n=1 Tax=unclassified Janthinobacterium TaxID=2610881 RepID=UPI00034BFDB0|nr:MULTISPECIES: TadE/TadG family type IV pilus assembly protein [unclassified Janthinobacterium]MEC5158919.1 Flp pilus assembly protein TadG [Janthinobacterium sp. CG_S6]
MSAPRTAARRGRQDGVAAVEFALVLPMLLLLLAVMVPIVQTFLYYNAMQNAVQNAARFMAATSAGDMSRGTKRALAVKAARQIVLDAAAGNGLRIEVPGDVSVMCNNVSCEANAPAPTTIRVFVLPFVLHVGVLQGVRDLFHLGSDFTIALDVTVPYGG